MDLDLNPNSSAFVTLGDDSRESSLLSKGVGKARLAGGEGEPVGAQACRQGAPCRQGGLAFVLQTLDLSCPWGGAK